MFGLFGSSSPTVLVTECDTWSGFYAAMAAIQQKGGKFKKVVCAVKNKNKEIVKQIEKQGGEIKEYDPSDINSIEQVMTDIDTVLLIAVHDKRTVELTSNIISAAEKAHVKSLLLWSSIGAAFHTTGSSGEGHKRIFSAFLEIEKLVKESKIEHECVLRNGFVVQMFFAFSQIMQNKGVFPLTSSSGKMAPVNGKDIGTASVMLLSDGRNMTKYNKQTLTLTGPAALSGPAITQILNRTLNTRIEFDEVSLEDMRKILESHADADPFDVCLALGLFELLNEGKLDMVTKDLSKVLGRDPIDMEEFFQENQDAFRPIGVMERHVLREWV